jgi:hypothetical protein
VPITTCTHAESRAADYLRSRASHSRAKSGRNIKCSESESCISSASNNRGDSGSESVHASASDYSNMKNSTMDNLKESWDIMDSMSEDVSMCMCMYMCVCMRHACRVVGHHGLHE